MDLGIAGKKAIVCASSKGLGKACALALAREGVDVVINGRSQRSLDDAAQDIERQTGAKVSAIASDLTTQEGRMRLLGACERPDILVTNVGGPPIGSFRDWDEAAWRRAIDQHMIPALMMIRAVIDGMVERRFGRIINITSRAVRSPMPFNGLSNGARAGLTAAVAGLSRQVAPSNVTINNILPGPFATERQTESLHQIATKSGRPFQDVAQERLAEIPAERFGSPDELGRLCAFLCAKDSGFIVGQNILIDGGAVNLI